jgi:hypothetical protein
MMLIGRRGEIRAHGLALEGVIDGEEVAAGAAVSVGVGLVSPVYKVLPGLSCLACVILSCMVSLSWLSIDSTNGFEWSCGGVGWAM